MNHSFRRTSLKEEKTKESIAAVAICLMFAGTGYSEQAFVFTQIASTPDQMIGAEILEAAFKRMDIPVTFKRYPGARALEMSAIRQRVMQEVLANPDTCK